MFRLTGLFVVTLFAASAMAESVPDCSTRLTKRLEAVTKQGYRLPLRAPKGKLQQYTDTYEVLCPWQTEVDLNGDGKVDWAGVIGQMGKYSLIVYASKGVNYFVHKIKTYKKFPAESYIGFLKLSKALELTGQMHKRFPVNYVLTENNIGAVSKAYVWNGKTFEELGGFIDETPIESVRQIEEEDRN